MSPGVLVATATAVTSELSRNMALSKVLANPANPGAVRHAMPRRHIHTPLASRHGERSGIHDPAGPTGSWGQGERIARKEQAAQEEAFGVRGAALEAQEVRSEHRQGAHPPGHAHVDRAAAVRKEMGEMGQEKADAAADEEYSHLSRLQKWFLELKGALYAFLKTGWEPL